MKSKKAKKEPYMNLRKHYKYADEHNTQTIFKSRKANKSNGGLGYQVNLGPMVAGVEKLPAITSPISKIIVDK